MRELFYDMVDLSNQMCVLDLGADRSPSSLLRKLWGLHHHAPDWRARGSAGYYRASRANPVLGTDAGARGRNPLHFTGGDRRLAVNYPPQGDGVQRNPSGVHWSKPIL